MQAWGVAAAVAAVVGTAGLALAQGDVIAGRRNGLKQMGDHMQAIGAVLQARGDQRQIVEQVDQMIPFYRGLPDRFPTETLTPPVAQGTQPGQTRALAAIAASREDFARRAADMVAALETLRSTAAAGNVSAELLRSTAATCSNCHRSFRGR